MSGASPSGTGAPRAFSGAASRLPGLDGLRGLAVAWVLAFHLWPDVVRGGWLGVGLFFTLSGYLIAGLIDTEVTATGRLSLGRFMARRARRLLPAALVTIGATLALTALVDDQPLRIIGIDALAAALNVFNWHASLDEAGYTAIFEAAPEPLAHFWSLAIEEQFYLVFPAAVALIRRPGRVVAAMAATGLFGVWLWWGSTDAYVATPVRTLEIAAGAGLAVAQSRSKAIRRIFRPAADAPLPFRFVWAALLVAAAACAVVSVARLGPDDGLVFRGGPQLMALCWVVLVIAAARDGWPSRFMSWVPLRWLGLRSYAIYLFHWPIIELTDWHPVAVIAVTLGLAEVSFHVLEMPVRRSTSRRAVGVLAAATAAVVAVSAAAVAASMPSRSLDEWAEATSELPAWLTEQDGATVVPPSTSSPPAARTVTGVATVPTVPVTPSTATEPRPDPLTEPEAFTPTTELSAAEHPTPDPIPSTATKPPNPDSEPSPQAPDVAGEAATDTTLPPGEPLTEPAATVPIVTVLGDSVALYMGGGLWVWAGENQTMAVLNHSRVACPPVGYPGSRWQRARAHADAEPRPLGWESDGPCRDDDIEPGSALVVVIDHGAVLFDHQRPDGSWASILDEDLASDVADSYRRLVAKAHAAGARVVFTTAPRPLPLPGDSEPRLPQAEPERTRAYNALLRDLVAELNADEGRPTVAVLDTAPELDAAGYDGPYGRADGTHLGFDRATVYAAEVLGPALLDILQN